MKMRLFIAFGFLVSMAMLALLVSGGVRATAAEPQPSFLTAPTLSGAAEGAPPAVDRHGVADTLHNSPVMFIESVGQFDPRARFQVRGGIGTMWLTEDALWITVVERSQVDTLERFDAACANVEREDEPLHGVNLRLSFPGTNPHPRIEPFDRLDTVVSYFIGNDPDQWHPDVPVWGGVRYVDMYPGMDLEVTSEGGRWTWRFVVRDSQFAISKVRLQVEGADALALDGHCLRLTTAVGEFTLPLLQVVGVSDASLTNPTLTGNQVALPFAPPIPNPQSAIANPQPSDLLYSTFLGGSGYDSGYAIAVEGSGVACVTGETWSSDFPITAGAFDTSYNDGYDAFVVKVNASGTGLAYATFLGGSSSDGGHGIAVDGIGAAYVTGQTRSSDFPTTAGAFDRSHNGESDAFVMKLDATGTALAYATFLGGSDGDFGDEGSAIAVDEAGSAYVTGWTASSDFPITAGAFDTSYNGNWDAFVVKVNADGTGLTYATFLGGGDDDDGSGIAVDQAGSAYMTGYTYSSDFPITPDAFDRTINGWSDAFVVKLNPRGSALDYATFLGGSDYDEGSATAVDEAGSAYMTGYTYSSDFPTTPDAFDRTISGWSDAFVVKLNPRESVLDYATFLGGSDDDWGSVVSVDEAGSAYVTGFTQSSDFPATRGAFDTSYNGNWDAFVVKVNASGTALAYATFLGGSDGDDGFTIAVEGTGSVYVAGWTESSDFPATAEAFDTSYNGGRDAFVAKLAVEPNAQNVELVGQIGGATNAVAVQGYYAYLGVGPRLVVLDVSNPANPTNAGQTGVLPDLVQDVFLSGSYAYVAAYRAGLWVVDISDPANPYETGYCATPGDAQDVFVSGSYAYVADGDLQVVHVSDSANPHRVGSYPTPGDAQDVFVSGSYAYVADGDLQVVDISDPANPYETGYCATPGDAQGVFVSGSYAYVADWSGLQVVNVSDPGNPYRVGYYHALGACVWGVFVSGSYAYVTGGAAAAYTFLLVVDISDPANPYAVRYYYGSGWTENVVFVSGSYAYVADRNKGLWVVDVSNPANPYEVGYYHTSGWAEDVFVSGSYAYALGGGLGVVDVSDPANPHEVGYCDTREGTSDIFVSGSYAYIVAWCPWCPVVAMAGLQVVNVSDPANPYETGYCATREGDTDIFVSGSYAYVVVDGDLWIMDVSDPHNPFEVGYWDTPGDARDVYVVGSLAYVVGNSGYPGYEGKLWVIDVSNPAAPMEVSACHTPERAEAVFVSGCYVYVIENSGYPDYEGGLRIIDVCNPANPQGYLDIQGASDVFVSGSYAHVAAGTDGLWVVDVSNPANPYEVGHYDTLGGANGVFVCDSHIYLADRDGGLLILRFTGGEAPLPTRAVDLAKRVIGAPYLWGGKGYNPSATPKRFFEWRIIKEEGYDYWNPEKRKIDFGKGLDCSGLSFWTYNRACFGEEELTWDEFESRPLYWLGANMQYKANVDEINKEELRPGDLLFFDEYPVGDNVMNHVATYIGPFSYEGKEYNVIHASGFADEIALAYYNSEDETLVTRVDNKKQILTVDGYGRVKEAERPEFKATAESPVDLIVIDPDGEVITKEIGESPTMEYMIYDINGDGKLDDLVASPERKIGNYSIQVVPEPDALPTDTYSLEVTANGQTIVLAEDVPISDIPDQPYVFESKYFICLSNITKNYRP